MSVYTIIVAYKDKICFQRAAVLWKGWSPRYYFNIFLTASKIKTTAGGEIMSTPIVVQPSTTTPSKGSNHG